MPLDTDRLVTFLEVARERGFSRAARRVGRTQSAVSQAVLHLERDVGQRLFVRDGRRTELTDAGRVLLEHAERALTELELAKERLSALTELRSGELVIGASDTLAYYFLPPVFQAFRAKYPGVDLRLDNRPSPVTAERVAERQVHVGVVGLPLPEARGPSARSLGDRIRIEVLAPFADVVICNAGHPFSKKRRVSIRELAKQPLLLLDRTTGSRAHLDRLFERHGERPSVRMEMASVEVLKRLVELGFGVSVVPAISVVREAKEGLLVARSLGGLRPARSVGIVSPLRGATSQAAAAFVEIAKAEIRTRHSTRP